MSKPVLTYTDVRGRAELMRLIFAEAGVDYEDRRISIETLKSISHDLPFGQVPTLEIDGHTIAQSIAIARYSAKKYGLYGHNDLEAAIADQIVDAQIDIGLANMATKTDEEKLKFKTEKLQSQLGYLERFLKNSGGDYFAGKTFTYGDIAIANRWYMLSTDYAEYMTSFPLLKAHYERVIARPNLANYLKNRKQTPY